MKSIFLSVLVTVTLSGVVFAEPGAPLGTHGGQQTQTQQQQQAYTPPVDNGAKLFQYVSACLVERPGTGGDLDQALRKALGR